MDANSISNVDYNTSLVNQHAADVKLAAEIIRGYWAVVLNLAPFPDGNMWCVLWGEDLQRGIAGFGATPIDAIRDFDVQMLNAKTPGAKDKVK
jgi:hypothetical protein